jgi:signal transduction histidine kinase/ActR/RegA family two-component response regulator
MSVATATCLTLVGTALLLVDRLTRVAQVLAILCLIAALLGLLGYAYGVPYYTLAYSSMALHTMASLILLSTGFLMSRPRRCLHRLLISRTLGGKLARRVLPATILVPLVVGWFRLKGEEAGLYNMRYGLTLYTLANIIILASIVWWNARMLDFSLLQKHRAEADRDDLLVREQAARARAEKALMARDQLLAVVSHELRTPLTPVLLTAAALEHRTQLPPDVQDDVRMIREQIEAEARLIDALLDLTSLQQGKITIKREHVDLNEAVRKAIATFGRLVESHGVTLDTALDETCPRIVGDPARLQQVATNLLSNSLKFTPHGGKISCRTFVRNGQVCLEISDTGAGMDPETLSRLFGPFEQGDPSTTRKFGGLGIGLAIARKLVDLHSGQILADSPGLDRGSTFTVSFPAGQAAPLSPAPQALPRSILLVDDNRATVKALQRLLQGHGHTISTAVSAKQGMEIAMTQPIDLIISDIGLPDLSGWEMMRQLRHKMELLARKPIRGIAISGFVDNDDKQKSLESGFVAHLAKPIDVNQLIETVNGALAVLR